MKKLKIIISLTLALIMTFSASAATQKDIDNAVKEKNQIKKNLDAEKNKKTQTEQEKKQIDNKVNALSDQLETLNISLATLDSKKTTITKELDKAEKKVKSQDELLKKRLRVMYEDGAISYLSVLCSSKSIFDFFYNLEILKQISEYDNNILDEMKKARQTIKRKKDELESVIAEEKKKRNELQIAENNLKAESDKKVAYMKELEKNISGYTKKLEQIEREEAALRAEISRQMSKQTGDNVPKTFVGGKFTWPTPGYTTITSKFGYRTHPVTKAYKLHTGVDVAVPSGVSVLAAADGVVTISGNHNAYGKYISINHGGGVATLYAHNSQLLVKAGDSVKKGQVISKSGNTGWSTGPHLHFEVLVNGNPVNPMQYFN